MVNTIREEVHLRVNLIAEEEITKILEILADMRKEMGIKKEDTQLEDMLKKTDASYLERQILEQMIKANRPLVEQIIKEVPGLVLYPVKKPIEIVHNLTTHGDAEVKVSADENKVVVETKPISK